MRKFIKNKKYFFTFFIFVFLFLFTFVFPAKAQTPGCIRNCECSNQADCELVNCTWNGTECCDRMEIDWPASPMGTSLTGCSTLPAMIKYIYEWGIALGGLAAFITLIMAGFQYLTSVGDPSKMKDARNKIVSAIMGLILLIGSWLVLNTINPALTTFHKITFTLEGMGEVETNFGPSNATPCSFAILYEKEKYDTAGGWDIVPSRECDPLCHEEYRTNDTYRSIRAFVPCVPCTPCSPEEVAIEDEAERKAAEEGLPLPERKCVDLDGDGIFYNKENCEDPEGNGVYYPERDNCEKVIIDKLGDDECSLFDYNNGCNGYWKEGGACTIQLFGDPPWTSFWEACGGKISETYAKHPNFGRITDETIDCFQLVKHSPDEY